MSEYFSGITFPQQKVTPSDDASIRRSVLADGILSGCEISYIGSTLTFGAGLLIGCGRQFRHTTVQNFAVTGATSGFARLVVTIDTTKASTKDNFNQIDAAIEYSAVLDGFTQLRQDDINEAGTVYQMQICVIALSSGGISGITSILRRIERPWRIEDGGTGATDPKTARENLEITPENIGAMSMELLWENASDISALPAQTIPLDLAEYWGVMIEFMTANHAGQFRRRFLSAIAKVGTDFVITSFGELGVSLVLRNGTVNTSGVTFETAYYFTSIGGAGGNGVASDSINVPIRIYGIKGVSA